MKWSCPHCKQQFELSGSETGRPFECPACKKLSVPSAPSRHGKATPAGGVRTSPPRPPVRRPTRGGGGFILVLLLIAAGAFCYASYRFNESPQQVWRRMVAFLETLVRPLPQPTPSPVFTPAPTPAITPTPAPSAPSAPPEAPTPARDPLSWILEHDAYRPKQVAILEAVEFPVVFNGKVSGSIKMPAGTTVSLIEATGGPDVLVDYMGGKKNVPLTSTDLRDRAAAQMAKADAEAVRAVDQAAAAAKASAAPSATPEVPREGSEDLVAGLEPAKAGAFVHPGLLHNEEDFKRMRTHKGREPWKSGWERLIANRHASLDYEPHPVENVVRGRDRLATAPENYASLFNDIAAAYACALRWRISGDRDYAEKSVEIMNAWSAVLKRLSGSTDVCLAAGIYGYEFANAAEIMRTYKGWKPEDFARFQKMMLDVFYPINKDFLERHNNTPIDHYWANWDLCNIASMMAIGVLCDKPSIYNDAVRYAKHGKGMGAIKNAIYHIHPDGLGQWQEAGRDQGHTVMGIGQMGAICEMAWKQGDDLYGYDDNRFLKGCEYVAKYNLGEDVPFRPYSNDKADHVVVSEQARGNLRPVWELVYNHYVKRRGLPAPYTTKMAEMVRPEGGGGDYGPNSGGYDQLGYGTLTATLDPDKNEKPAPSFGNK